MNKNVAIEKYEKLTYDLAKSVSKISDIKDRRQSLFTVFLSIIAFFMSACIFSYNILLFLCLKLYQNFQYL